MTSNKCPKCGFITLATATQCKNCSHKFTSAKNENTSQAENINSENKPQSWIDTFCGLNLLAASIFLGIVFCLYWNSYVLSYVLPSGRYPIILLIICYLPAGILAIIGGGIWYAVLRFTFKTMGFKVSEVG